MKAMSLMGAGAVLALATPALAQNYPLVEGDYVEVTSVTVDDGHGLDYATFLATQWKAQEEFAKAQGWITGYEILSNVYKRAGEADLLLVINYKLLPDATELAHREQVIRDHMKQTDAQMEASSGDRAKYRHVIGSQLLQVMNFR
jgi:hypothetical protein